MIGEKSSCSYDTICMPGLRQAHCMGLLQSVVIAPVWLLELNCRSRIKGFSAVEIIAAFSTQLPRFPLIAPPLYTLIRDQPCDPRLASFPIRGNIVLVYIHFD